MTKPEPNQTEFPEVFIDPLMTNQGAGPMTKSNQRLRWLLCIILALAPIPLGSNRPLYWAFWAIAIAAILIWYTATLLFKKSEARVPISAFPAVSVLFFCVLWVMGIQALPIASLFGDIGFASQTGFEFKSQSLSIAPADTWLAFLRWATYGMFFYLVLQVGARSSRARFIFKALIVFTTLQALFAALAVTQLGDMVLFFEKEQYAGSATGTFINRNSAATYLSLGAIMATALLMRPSGSKKRSKGRKPSGSFGGEWLGKVIVLCALIFMLIALYMTQSRLGVLSGMAGIFVVLLLRASQIAHVRFIFVAGPVGVILLLAVFGGGLLDRFIDIFTGFDKRLAIYTIAFDMIKDRPFLGFGADSFKLAFPLYHDLTVPTQFLWDKAHSTYLAHWVELGVFVGSMPILILMLLVWPLIKQCFGQDRIRTESIAALGATATIAVHSVFDFSMEMQAIVFQYLAILGLAVALKAGGERYRKRSAPKSRKTGHQISGSDNAFLEKSSKKRASLSRQGLANSADERRPRLHYPMLPAAVYAIGDVHGRLDLLYKLEQKIFEDARHIEGEKWIILLGDFVDRGPQTAQIIEYLRSSQPQGFRRIQIAGNHEVMMQAFLAGEPNSVSWLGFGGAETLRSYGISDKETQQIAKGGSSAEYLLSSQIPVSHIEFLKNLPDAVVTPSHIFVHIGMDEKYSIAREVDFAARLSEAKGSNDDAEPLIVHGHKVVAEPLLYGNQLNIDTGAYETGLLTAVRIVSGEALHFLDTRDDDG